MAVDDVERRKIEFPLPRKSQIYSMCWVLRLLRMNKNSINDNEKPFRSFIVVLFLTFKR